MCGGEGGRVSPFVLLLRRPWLRSRPCPPRIERCFARYEEGHQKWDLINCRPRRAFIAVHGSPHKAAAGYRRTWREGHNASSKFFVGGPLHTLNHREETAA